MKQKDIDNIKKAPKLVSNKTYSGEFSGAGKGDAPRPVDKRKYDENYDAIFRKKEEGGDCGKKCKCERRRKADE